MAQEYYIYKVTCQTTKKCYVGQTQKYKHKDTKPYNYGVSGRWCDHVSTSKKTDTPLCQAIREYGSDNFTLETIECIDEASADEREAYWISELETLVPNGYNVKSYSRCKHRCDTSIANMYLDTAESVKLRTIKKDGTPKIVYLYIYTPSETKRLTFGQSKYTTFEEALKEANGVLDKFREKGVRIDEDDLPFKHEVLQKVRVVPFNKTMIAVYLKTKDGDQRRICFGGKTISFEKAIENANVFISKLSFEKLENNLLTSSQQVATILDEANSSTGK